MERRGYVNVGLSKRVTFSLPCNQKKTEQGTKVTKPIYIAIIHQAQAKYWKHTSRKIFYTIKIPMRLSNLAGLVTVTQRRTLAGGPGASNSGDLGWGSPSTFLLQP